MARKKTYTREQLEGMNAKAMKKMAFNTLGLVGLSKQPKAAVIDAILASQDSAAVAPKKAKKKAAAKAAASGPIKGIDFSGHSVMSNPSAPFGQKTTTTIHVSCGASSGSFPVMGKTVREVGEFLREVLNVDRLSTGLVNGKEVSADYVLKSGDRLEFLKPAGRKG
jgi:hypothetical protein